MGQTVLRRGELATTQDPGELQAWRGVARPAVYFALNIGDALLTLPAVRALAQVFAEPLTVICPRFAFDLCFAEVSPHHGDITDLLPFPAPSGPQRPRTPEEIAASIGTVDLFINTVLWSVPLHHSTEALRKLLAPRLSIGFPGDIDNYDLLVEREPGHTADQLFQLPRLFDDALRIEDFAQPITVAPHVSARARAARAAVGADTKVLVVHADSAWAAKQWPVTRWIDLLDRFCERHRDFVVWVVGMGAETMDVGRARRRIHSQLGLPLDLTMSMVACADLFVGVDSSMLHAADLAGVPGVGLFGITWARSWGFRFSPHRHVDVSEMADITVEDVLAALEDLGEERGLFGDAAVGRR